MSQLNNSDLLKTFHQNKLFIKPIHHRATRNSPPGDTLISDMNTKPNQIWPFRNVHCIVHCVVRIGGIERIIKRAHDQTHLANCNLWDAMCPKAKKHIDQ